MRDVYKDENYFRAQVADCEERFEESLQYLKEDNTEQARQADLYSLYEIQLEKTISLFCLGLSGEEVKGELRKAWPLFITAMNYSLSTSLPLTQKRQFVPAGKATLFPLLVLSGCGETTAKEILAFTNSELNYQVNNEHQEVDAGFDPFTYEFARYFGFEAARVHPHLCWEKLYGPLHDCFPAPEQERSRILSDYVEGWQRRAVREEIYLKDAHVLQTNEDFRGYWCFLAAAVAKMLDIDDSALKSHPHYPYDLRHARIAT